MEAKPLVPTQAQDRLLHYDLLRILAVFCVVVVHVSSSQVSACAVNSSTWRIFVAYDGLSRFCVPVLVMISGAMMLGKEKYTLRYLLTHNILRLVTAFLAWSFGYAVCAALVRGSADGLGALLREIVGETLRGQFHMWFLFMIVGLYLLIPLLNRIVSDRRLTLYFLLLALLFECGFRTLKLVPALSAYAGYVEEKIGMRFVMGYSGYFVAGYYLHAYGVGPRTRRILYALGAAGLLATILGTYGLSAIKGSLDESAFRYLGLPVCCVSVAVFLFFRERVSKCRWTGGQARAIAAVSRLCLGAYLAHFLFLSAFKYAGVTTLLFHPLLSVPVLSLLAFALSLGMSLVISRIPVLNRYVI